MNSEAALQGGPADTAIPAVDDSTGHGRKPTAAELLATDGALLSRSHLRELGLERRAIDSVFRTLDVVVLPGYSRPLVKAADYAALLEQSTYRGDRVRA